MKFLPNVEEVDNKVMKLLCDEALANQHYWVNAADLVNQAEALGGRQEPVSRDDGPKDERNRGKWRQGPPLGKGQDKWA